jgi:hypothetical protein
LGQIFLFKTKFCIDLPWLDLAKPMCNNPPLMLM